MQETLVWSLGWEDPLEEEIAAHSSILTWKISWTEEPGGLQSMGFQSQTRLSMHTKNYGAINQAWGSSKCRLWATAQVTHRWSWCFFFKSELSDSYNVGEMSIPLSLAIQRLEANRNYTQWNEWYNLQILYKYISLHLFVHYFNAYIITIIWIWLYIKKNFRKINKVYIWLCIVLFSHLVVYDSLRPHGL